MENSPQVFNLDNKEYFLVTRIHNLISLRYNLNSYNQANRIINIVHHLLSLLPTFRGRSILWYEIYGGFDVETDVEAFMRPETFSLLDLSMDLAHWEPFNAPGGTVGTEYQQVTNFYRMLSLSPIPQCKWPSCQTIYFYRSITLELFVKQFVYI